jgi:hypothetical protein
MSLSTAPSELTRFLSLLLTGAPLLTILLAIRPPHNDYLK